MTRKYHKKNLTADRYDAIKKMLDLNKGQFTYKQLSEILKLSTATLYMINRFGTFQEYKQYNEKRLAKKEVTPHMTVSEGVNVVSAVAEQLPVVSNKDVQETIEELIFNLKTLNTNLEWLSKSMGKKEEKPQAPTIYRRPSFFRRNNA